MLTNQAFLTLSERFGNIKAQYDVGHRKYIHSKTVDNLLHHADSFSLKHHKDQIYITLAEYFDIIDTDHIDNTGDALNLFNKYINPLTILYADLRGFHLATKLWLIFVSAFLIFLLLYFLNTSIYFYIGLLILCLAAIFRQFYFERKGKTYAFMY